MIKGFRGADGDTHPVPFECEKFGHPNATSTGEKMYDNTHFLTEQEAWESIMKSVTAGIKLARRRVANADSELAKAMANAASAGIEFADALDGYEQWQRRLKAESAGRSLEFYIWT